MRVTAEKTWLLPVTVTHTLGVDLAVPSVSWTAPSLLHVGVAINAMTPVTGATDIVSYSATGLPSGLAIDGTTGVIGGTPDTADENIATATVRVTDTAGNAGEVPIVFPVVQAFDLLLTVGTIAGDDVVNIAEKAAGFTVSGSVSASIAGRNRLAGGCVGERGGGLAAAVERDVGQRGCVVGARPGAGVLDCGDERAGDGEGGEGRVRVAGRDGAQARCGRVGALGELDVAGVAAGG